MSTPQDRLEPQSGDPEPPTSRATHVVKADPGWSVIEGCIDLVRRRVEKVCHHG